VTDSVTDNQESRDSAIFVLIGGGGYCKVNSIKKQFSSLVKKTAFFFSINSTKCGYKAFKKGKGKRGLIRYPLL